MSFTRHFITGGLVVLLASITFVRPIAAQNTETMAPTMERVSAGRNGGGGGEYTALSSNGQVVVFESTSSRLVDGHIDDSMDVFLYDRQGVQMERVSTRSDGSAVYNPGDYTSPPAISGNGRFVAFTSRSEDLVPNDQNLKPDVFVHDRVTGQTELISVATNGQSGNDYSSTAAISADGRFVVFQSWADNLVKADPNESVDIFLRDRQTGETSMVSVTTAEQQGSDWHEYGFSSVSISGDGRYVAFSYDNLAATGFPGFAQSGIYLRNLQARTTRWLAPGEYPVLSATGEYLAFVTSADLLPADENGGSDVYVYSLASDQFDRVSVSENGEEVMEQWIYSAPDLSEDGRFVVFESNAPTLVSGDENGLSDIFLRDRALNITSLISMNLEGAAANGESHHPSIADNGGAVAFTSSATDLAAGDENDRVDVFVQTRPGTGLSVLPHYLYLPILRD